MQDLMFRLGNPQEELRFVHVAGSNGKGSVCAMLSSILTAAGYRTGLYTSPHLVRVNERMKIDGVDISDEDLICAAEQVKAAVEQMDDKPTEFEVITAMAFLYFRQQKCDIVVLEVGLGGRLDATNVISVPELAILMNIGLEHTEVLGDTLQKIAAEKAGIIKRGGTIVFYPQLPSVESVFEEACIQQNATFVRADTGDILVREESLEGSVFDWKQRKQLRINLLGQHQIWNAVVALTAAEQLGRKGWLIGESSIRNGLANTYWPARLEILNEAPLFILDGAHNPQCVEMLEQIMQTLFHNRKVVFLTGLLRDKDYLKMLNLISHRIKEVVCLTPDSERALPAEALVSVLAGFEIKATAFDDVERGIIAAFTAAKGSPIVAFGSLYLAGAIRSIFPRAMKKWLRSESIRLRDAMSESQRTASSREIVQRIVESDLFLHAKTVMSYRAMKSEVDLNELDEHAKRMGKRIVYPRCISATEMIALYPVSDEDWQRSGFGILEPSLDTAIQVDPAEIDLMLCPCTAFDEAGNRIGMGGGYFDRYLPLCTNATVAAVAFELQKARSIQPEPHDRRMDLVFTDSMTYFINPDKRDAD
ncbi:MAG TPA: 5-formyltetrahydrofolate cyclo-ligase [Clostridia bacterium]|nr:5-formyltetrahydrofolate cyclo-ligase [Clostridia bacterium]